MASRGTFLTRTLGPLALGAGALLLQGAPASAFDRTDCNAMFGSANVARVQQFNIEAGRADFGDELHLFGAPQGKAVICWSLDGRVAVKGKLYADAGFNEFVEAGIRIRFRRTNGRLTGTTTRTVRTQGFLASRVVEVVSPAGRMNQVRIELTRFQETGLATPPRAAIVAQRTFNR